MPNLLRDRIVAPAGSIPYERAKPLLTQFEADVAQAKQLQKTGVIQTMIIDGGSTAEEIITVVTLEENDNKNNTYRYASRNLYIKSLFNDLNESGLNVVWLSKAKPLWINDKKTSDYIPDCHDDIPFMVDVNIYMKVTYLNPVGVKFVGVLGRNSVNMQLHGLEIAGITYQSLCNVLWPPVVAQAEEVVASAQS